VTAVKAFRLDREKLVPLLFQHTRIAIRRRVAGLDQLEATQRRVLRLMRGSVKERVAEMVIDDSDRSGNLHVSQASLEELLGTSRQSVNQALSELRATEAVETGYGVTSVADREALLAAAGR
jgi:CRP-like cAMP-binding protein